jgi:hypothetical protein
VNGNLDRRRFVRLAALSGAAALAGGGTAPSLGNHQPIRLGVEILVLDSQSSPERAGVAARDLIDRAQADFPNVSRTPLVGGQWRKGTTWPFELAIVSNTIHPEIPATGTLQSIT